MNRPMLAEPKPRFLRIFLERAVKIKCLSKTDVNSDNTEFFDFILMPGEHILAFRVDENGRILGPWDPKEKMK